LEDNRRAARGRHPVGMASWPGGEGPWNDNTSPVAVTGRGEVLWSAPLPSPVVEAIAVASDGSIFVACTPALVSFDSSGDMRWKVKSWPARYLSMWALENGRLLVPELAPEGLAVRSQTDGELLAFMRGDWTTPGVTAQGNAVHVQTDDWDFTGIRMFDLEGRLLWATPMGDPAWVSPLALDELIIVPDFSYLHAYSVDGTLLWIANHNGFELADDANRAALAAKEDEDEDIGPMDSPIWASGNLVLVQFKNVGYVAFDLSSYTVKRLESLPFGRRVALPWVPGTGPCLVNTRGEEPDTHRNEDGLHIWCYDLGGRLCWKHPIGDVPYKMIADAEGKVIASHSCGFEYYEKHKEDRARREALDRECFVRCLSAQGEELFTWYPEGPFDSPLAIGAAGEIYVAAKGRLWAIG
jgi:hypothetical protein